MNRCVRPSATPGWRSESRWNSQTANLAAALAAGATLREALELANAAAAVVIHKLGTTGTASLDEIGRLAE